VDLRIHATITYNPPLEQFKFPMVAGNTWTALSSRDAREGFKINGNSFPGYPRNTTASESTAYSIPSKGAKSVTAGDFDSFVIKSADDESWWADASGSYVKHIDSSGSEPVTLELLSFKYTPPVPEQGLLGTYFGIPYFLLLVLAR
jgi:hypothetical protein